MNDNFCYAGQIQDFDYSYSQIERGIYELEFENPNENPWKEFKYFVRVGGGYRGFKKKTDARKYYNAD